MKYVKASERLPESNKDVFYRYDEVHRFCGQLLDDEFGKRFRDDGGQSLHEEYFERVEWLEESESGGSDGVEKKD